ncbi:peptidase [Agromyces intestinalis]|uniref:Peptidase n=1 Tax=Agromyces intestinalis TaxID=2592652 RepID=A0A5C1YD31_9MICO|nr:M64 family metallopeptidase [Agromyces intestinalis]QEO13971.1 peptidase [Agromyces intestinalis]
MTDPSKTARRRTAVAALAVPLLVGGLVAVGAQPAAADDAVGSATLVPIQITGDPAERFSLVILGDGYTAAELPKFREQVDEHLETMWSIEPYKSYRNSFNVYAVEIVSGESGVSCDDSLDSPRRDTPLKMAFWGGCSASSVQRLLTVNNTIARQYANLAPKVDQILALANSDTYGGAGGAYATASGGNALSALISPHEIGHSLGGLQDEYDYYTRGVTTGNYTGGEPSSAHHTKLTVDQMAAQQVKWWRWLGEPSESGGVIGAYEGGMYYSTGVWRPSRHSMMKTLGYQFDQVGREIMTERISSKVPLVPASTPEGTVARDAVLWVETSHPVYHEIDVTWSVNGEAVDLGGNQRNLDLATLDVAAGATVTATIVDNTEFVRDPALRARASMTQTRTWTVGDTTLPEATPSTPEITEATTTDHAAGSSDVLYVETNHPDGRIMDVAWQVDGVTVPNPYAKRNLPLATLGLGAGEHTVTATVTDPEFPDAGSVVQTWTVDAAGPSVEATITAPIASSTAANGEPHYVVNEQFDMKLVATDDRDGALVTEFRLDGDGWHNYYGWPTDKDAPFRFTPTGTNIDDLIYGNLGTGGMSLSPFQEREPGYGTHRVEYRATDAAGNIGEVKAFTVTVLGGDDADPRQVIQADVTGGALSMAVSSTDPVVLEPVVLTGADQSTSGSLHAVRVSDSRGTAAGWNLTGQVSDFTSGTGVILAENLGWTPAASVETGGLPTVDEEAPVVTPGAGVAPGAGLRAPLTLCAAGTGHSAGAFACSGGLELGVPGSTRSGTYTGVLTLTLI